MTLALITSSTSSTFATGLDAYREFKKGTLYRKYAQANPIESAAIEAYWNNGPRPAPRTATGRALVMWADLHRGNIQWLMA